MKLLLKTLLQRRARDEGFTLPMVIALGLVMLLLGAINITIANEENLTAISQNSRSDALAIAEVGIARYRELLDRNRILVLHNSDRWTGRANVCDDDIASFLPGTPAKTITLTEESPLDFNNDGDSTDSETIGSYSLVSYEYDNDNTTGDADDNGIFSLASDANTDDDPLPNPPGPVVAANSITDENDTNDDGQSDTRGILTVRGIATNDGGQSIGEAQIQVEIPIRINLDDMENLAPALWIGDNTVNTADLSPLTIGNGNVVIKDPAVTTGTTRDGCRDFSSLASTTPRRPVISDSRDLPLIQEVIDDVANARTAHSVTAGALNTPLVDTPNPRQFLFGATQQMVGGSLVSTRPYNPDTDSTNCPNIKLCRYYYDPPETAGLTYTDRDLLTDGVARTTLLLNQPLTISATNDLITGKDVKVGSTSNLVNDSNAFEIYVRDNDTVSTNGSANNIIINADAGRTVTINGFIHAPQSTLTITGGGTVNFRGSVWVGDFINNSGGTVNISPDLITRVPTASDPSTSGRAYKFYSTTDSRAPRPLTGSPTNWKTEQIN